MAARVLLASVVSAAPESDYYADLGVSRSATADEIRAAYHERAKAVHPDKSKEPDATARFQRLSKAYSVLSDEGRRREYNAQLDGVPRWMPSGRSGFEDVFGGFGRGPAASFSATMQLTSTNFDDLVGADGRLWLVLFYRESSRVCKQFAPHWETLAARLEPLVGLGRVNTDSVRPRAASRARPAPRAHRTTNRPRPRPVRSQQRAT